MKKVLFTLILALSFTVSMAAQVKNNVDHSLQKPNVEIVEALDIAALIGVSENKLSEEALIKIVYEGNIPNRPHFIFHTLQQCQSIPECTCEPYQGRWGCFIR